MKKYILFIICILLSTGILLLSLVSNSITCTKTDNNCVFTSKIPRLNIVLNKEVFPLESINKVSCEKKIQPSKKGRKSYYLLKIDINDRPYNLSTYSKYRECKAVSNNIKKNIKDPALNIITFNSSTGATNTLGLIFALIILIVGVIILREKEVPQDALEEEEEE